MKLKEFKEWFADFANGVPVEGTNSSQWKKLVTTVNSLEVEVVKAPAKEVTK
jgi:hypothetical protein